MSDDDASNDGTSKKDSIYANRHIPKFLTLPEGDDGYYAHGSGTTTTTTTDTGVRERLIQVVKDGRMLTAKRLLANHKEGDLTLTRPILVEDTPKSIGMKVLSFRNRPVSVRDIADIIGHDYPVHVIDVEHQEELDGWRMTDLVEYFEDEERLMYHHETEVSALLSSRIKADNATTNTATATGSSDATKRTSRRPRKAAEKCRLSRTKMTRPRVLNQISLEFSKTPLSQHILSPQFVRDLDWIDHAWPGRRGSEGKPDTSGSIYPSVQYYCLTSAAGCYTDFHIDFGGTAVWYHIMNGEKIFCLIPPTKENLAVYEDWLCRPDQAELFLPDMIDNPTSNVFRLSLRAGQTLLIPTGWIHAVYTPQDSVVLGGNFLHGMDIALQVEIHCIETRTRVQEKFRFPFFIPLNFYAAGRYLRKLRSGDISQREVDGLSALIPVLEQWWTVHQSEQSQVKTGPSVIAAARHAAAQNQCATVESFLAKLKGEHERVVQHGISKSSDYGSTSGLRISLSAAASTTAIGVAQKSSSSPGKLKLRLKLPGRSATGGTDSAASTPRGGGGGGGGGGTPRGPESGGGGGGFRIVVSSDAVKQSAPLPHIVDTKKRPRKPREDTEWYVEEHPAPEDDDWMPSKRAEREAATKRRLSASGGIPTSKPQPQRPPPPVSPRTMMSSKGGGGVDPHQNKRHKVGAGASKSAPPQKATTSSRQRLMKRFR